MSPKDLAIWPKALHNKLMQTAGEGHILDA